MDPVILGLLGIVVLLVLLAIGVHIGVALGVVGVVGSALIVGFEGSVYPSVSSIYHKVASFELITIPLFVLMGYLASGGGISKKTFEALNAWVGRMRGGLGISSVVSCTAFGAVCGSSMVVAAVFARLCAPEMRKLGYDKKLSYGVCSSAGMIGMLIPPSILAVVYAVLAGESTGKILIAGIAPGVLLMVMFSLLILFIGWIRPGSIQPVMGHERISWGKKFRLLCDIWQVLVVAFLIFGGIFGGIFNPTEAAAVATVALILLLAGAKWGESWALLGEAFHQTASTSAMIFLVMGSASVFSQFLVLTGISEKVVEFVVSADLSKLSFIIMVIVIYLVLGCLLDSISMLCITIPLFNPIVQQMGIHPIWYAVIVIMSIESGLLTPPVGLNVYATYAVAEKDVTLEEIFAGSFPFLLTVFLSIVFLLFFPSFSTFLPEMMLGK